MIELSKNEVSILIGSINGSREDFIFARGILDNCKPNRTYNKIINTLLLSKKWERAGDMLFSTDRSLKIKNYTYRFWKYRVICFVLWLICLIGGTCGISYLIPFSALIINVPLFIPQKLMYKIGGM